MGLGISFLKFKYDFRNIHVLCLAGNIIIFNKLGDVEKENTNLQCKIPLVHTWTKSSDSDSDFQHNTARDNYLPAHYDHQCFIHDVVNLARNRNQCYH